MGIGPSSEIGMVSPDPFGLRRSRAKFCPIIAVRGEWSVRSAAIREP